MSNLVYKHTGEAPLKGQPKKPLFLVTKTKAVFDDSGVSQDAINKKLFDAFKQQIVTNGTTTIGSDGYWYVDGVKTEIKAQGESGKDADIWTIIDDYWHKNGKKTEFQSKGADGLPGKDAINPILRLSDNGFDIEASADNGETWLPLIKDFSKVRVLGYVDSVDGLPKNANVGDIYGVWDVQPTEEDPEAGVYKLYINTVKDWIEDYTITKIYDYDTELPSSASDNMAVLVPVTNLTLDKEKVDGYKVYKYSSANNGWVMVLNTAEIYASKDDIVNYGDNVYALVQGETAGTYELYRREVGWVYFGTNASIAYHLVQSVEDGSETNILSGKAVKDAIEAESQASSQAVNAEIQRATDAEQAITEDLANYKEEVKDTYGDYAESPEFVRVVTDKDGRMLYGVQKDGNFYFGAGCPQQVKEYVLSKIAEVNTAVDKVNTAIDKIVGVEDVTETIDTLNEMVAFFEGIRNDETLQQLLATSASAVASAVAAERERAEAAQQTLENNKVDKEDGKGLVPLQYVEEVESPEFVSVWLTGDGRILYGVQGDGNFYFGAGVPKQVVDYIERRVAELKPEGYDDVISFIGDYLAETTLEELLDRKIDGEYVDNPEFAHVKLDAEGRILEGTKADGTKVVNGDLAVRGDLDLQGVKAEVVDNPEWMEAETDAGGRILGGIRRDGTRVVETDVELGGDVTFRNGIPQQLAEYIAEHASTGTGVQGIEYDGETGDLYATYDDESGVTDVYMESNGDIYVEIEE